MTNKKNKQAKKRQTAANGTASGSTTNGIDSYVLANLHSIYRLMCTFPGKPQEKVGANECGFS